MSNEFDYTKLKHVTSVDQSDREVPYNLRQSGPTKVEMLISTRVRKSPYWHLSMQAGCWRATVYNRIYHPRGYVCLLYTSPSPRDRSLSRMPSSA